MNPRVIKATYNGNYQLLITFTNNEVRQFDLAVYLDYPVYEPLKDENFCKKVYVTDGVIQWDEDIDFDPDTIYIESKPISSGLELISTL